MNLYIYTGVCSLMEVRCLYDSWNIGSIEKFLFSMKKHILDILENILQY